MPGKTICQVHEWGFDTGGACPWCEPAPTPAAAAASPQRVPIGSVVRVDGKGVATVRIGPGPWTWTYSPPGVYVPPASSCECEACKDATYAAQAVANTVPKREHNAP